MFRRSIMLRCCLCTSFVLTIALSTQLCFVSTTESSSVDAGTSSYNDTRSDGMNNKSLTSLISSTDDSVIYTSSSLTKDALSGSRNDASENFRQDNLENETNLSTTQSYRNESGHVVSTPPPVPDDYPNRPRPPPSPNFKDHVTTTTVSYLPEADDTRYPPNDNSWHLPNDDDNDPVDDRGSNQAGDGDWYPRGDDYYYNDDSYNMYDAPQRFDVTIVSPFNLTEDDEVEFWRQLALAYFDFCELSCKTGNTEERLFKICDSCYCDEACFAYGDCCPDKYGEAGHGPVVNSRSRSIRCSRTSFSSSATREYRMVTECPENSVDQDLVRGCVSNDTRWRYMLPVLDTESLLAFKNKYCASCHNVTSTIDWDAVLQLHDPSSIVDLVTPLEIFNRVLADDENGIVFDCSEAWQTHCRPCKSEISRCNVSGLWRHDMYDPLVARACEAMHAPVAHWVTMWEKQRYRNPFCYLCNTGHTWGYLLNEMELPGLEGPPETPPLLLLLDWRDDASGDHDDEEEVVDAPMCQPSHVYDDYTSSCRKVHCAVGRRFVSTDNGSCKSSIRTTNMFGYRFCLHTTTNSPVHVLYDHLEDVLYRSWRILDKFGLSMKSMDVVKYPYDRYNQSRFDALFLVLDFIASDPIERDVTDAAILGNMTEIMEAFRHNFNLTDLKMAPTCSKGAFKIIMKIANDLHPVLEVLEEAVSVRNMLLKDGDTDVLFLPATQQLLCPAVELEACEFSFNHDTNNLDLHQSGRRVPESHFYVTEQLTALICWEPVQDRDTKEQAKEGRDEVLPLVDKICGTISLVFLLVAFILYCAVPSLRSIAGINNMVLILSLFWAQICLQAGANFSLDDGLCQVVGVATHFLWLCVVFAQNTCTFHMFYTLSFPIRSHGLNTRVHTVVSRYVTYVLTMSCSFVLASAVWNVAAEGHSGYGGNGCFVRRAMVRIVTFATPLSLTLLANIAMFFFTVARLRAMPTVSSTHSHRISLLMYTKLSVFTGVTWLFGFLATATGSAAFSYVFIILQNLQGLFVFLAFFANRGVWKMIKERCGKTVGKKTFSADNSRAHAHQSGLHVVSHVGQGTPQTSLTS